MDIFLGEEKDEKEKIGEKKKTPGIRTLTPLPKIYIYNQYRWTDGQTDRETETRHSFVYIELPHSSDLAIPKYALILGIKRKEKFLSNIYLNYNCINKCPSGLVDGELKKEKKS